MASQKGSHARSKVALNLRASVQTDARGRPTNSHRSFLTFSVATKHPCNHIYDPCGPVARARARQVLIAKRHSGRRFGMLYVRSALVSLRADCTHATKSREPNIISFRCITSCLALEATAATLTLVRPSSPASSRAQGSSARVFARSSNNCLQKHGNNCEHAQSRQVVGQSKRSVGP